MSPPPAFTAGKKAKAPAKNATETVKKTSKQTSLPVDSTPGNTTETQGLLPPKLLLLPPKNLLRLALKKMPRPLPYSRCTCIYVNIVVNKKFMFI